MKSRTMIKLNINFHRLLRTFVVFLIALSPTQGRAQDTSLVLTSTGPATLDIPIRLTATYNDFNENDVIEYEWKDDLSHQQTVQATSSHSNWTLIYKRESFLYSTGKRRVTVIVKKNNVQVATSHLDFELNDYISGKVLIEQQHGNQTNLTALIHDPHDWIRNHNTDVLFTWVINKKMIATCNTPSLLINFTEPGDYTIQASVYLETVDHVITSNELIEKRLQPSRRTWECTGWWPNNAVNVSIERQPVKVQVGFFFIKTTVRYNTGSQLLCYFFIILILSIIILFLSVFLFVSKIKSINLTGYIQKKVKYILQLCRNREDLTPTSARPFTKVPSGDTECL